MFYSYNIVIHNTVNMGLIQLMEQISSKESACRFLQNRGILRQQPPLCNVCNEPMSLVKDASRVLDGITWRCKTHKGRKISIRDGSFISDFRSDLRTIILSAYFWALDLHNHQVQAMLDTSKSTVVQYFQFYRDVCSTWLLNNPIQLGGVGTVVQIDECVISKRKYNRGHHVPERWIFGMYDINQGVGSIEFVDRRSANVLLPIIQRKVIPGTTIHSDQWAAYNGIAQINVNPPYIHETVNHSVNFRDPNTGVHTNNVECFWKNCKLKLKGMCGVDSESLPSYIDEFLWRQFNGGHSEEAFDSLLEHISVWFPPY